MFIPRCQSARRLLFGLLFGASLFIILGLGQANFSPFRTAAIAQDISAEQWMQRGVDHYRTGSIEEAITDWQSALTLYQANHALEQVAVTLENLARGYQALGQTRMELDYWQRADSIYQQLGNKLRIGRVLMEQAQTYSRMGQYGRAITILCSEPDEVAQICHAESALGIVRSLPERDRVGEVVAYGSLGDAYRLRGEPERALEYLEQGLRIARELQEPVYLISTLNSLGNTHLSLAQLNYRRALSAQQIEEAKEATTFELKAQEQDAKALEYLKESFALAQANADRAAQLRALISTLPIYYRSENREQNAQILQQAIILAESLPYSQEQVYALIDLAKFVQLRPSASTMSTGQHCISLVVEPQAQQLLEQAIISAQQISDRRAESFALGALGHLYECQKDYDRALALTRQAQISADQALQIRDSLYLWQWQTGRIFRAQGQVEQAIEAYEQSLATLDALRKDILTASRDVQFDFREAVEPIYRQLVELSLQQEQASTIMRVSDQEPVVKLNHISLALNTLDTLKLAELQNYFGNDCVLTALNRVNINFASMASQTAIFSTVVLEDRVAVIVSIPTQRSTGEQQTLQQFEWIKDQNNKDVDRATLIATVNKYRRGLEVVADAITGYDTTLANQLYDWMIRPFEPLLQQHEIQTLIFVQDGIFRSVPMAPLHDGNTFLVDRYAIAVTPSLNLTNLDRTNHQQLRALAVGLTQNTTVNGTRFPALEYVESELQVIQQILPRSLKLLNQDFTLDRFEQVLETESYPIIHIATHGKFSADADNTFLVTGASPTQPDQRITIKVLDNIIRRASARSPVELLVLSACQTATGDDRAALGLAGIAAQAGAKRVLASLWSVNDRATTELISQFYQDVFNGNMTNAQALQAAQKKLIHTDKYTAHPAFWGAFILIGNWL